MNEPEAEFRSIMFKILQEGVKLQCVNLSIG